MTSSSCIRAVASKMIAVALIALVVVPLSARAEALIEVVGESSNLVVRFIEKFGEMDVSEGYPTVEVYGDRRVVVFYPAYMKRAGQYETTLSQQEFDALLNNLSDNNIPSFSSEAAAESLEEAAGARSSRGELRASTDPATTILELNLDSYSADATVAPAAAVNQRIVWKGLRTAAQEFPEVAEIQSLSNSQAQVKALRDRSDLVKVDTAETDQ